MRVLRAIWAPIVLLILPGALLALFLHPVFLLLALIGALDCNGRRRDSLYLSRHKYLTPRLADYYGKSFCGRQVVEAAVRCVVETNGPSAWSFTVSDYYWSKGYRWYHVFPVGFPAILFNLRFWRNLFRGHV